jgi:hypothetical protein
MHITVLVSMRAKGTLEEFKSLVNLIMLPVAQAG